MRIYGCIQHARLARAITGCLLFFLITSKVFSATGVDWLATQAHGDGSYAGVADITPPYQATTEVLQTFHTLGVSAQQSGVTAALQFVGTETYHNTENLSRKIIVLHDAGQDVTSLVTELLAMQNPDGGFGELAGYDSTALDTAYALQALNNAGYSDTQVIGSAIAYLSQQQATNGGFGLESPNDSSIHVTAQSSLALQPYIFTYAVGNQINKASEYLYSLQLPGGGWTTVWETAEALLALIPVTTDSSRYVNALDVLKNAQLLNGSWADDVFITALAERAVFLAANATLPVDPTAGALKGKVVSSAGLALNGVSISAASPSTTQTTTTGLDGTFMIQNLPVENYTVTYALNGYVSATQQVSLQAGQVIDLGTIKLNPVPDQGVLQGTVTDRDTGQPIAGAGIDITGSTNASVLTDALGKFNVLVAPGTITVSAVATGYAAVSGTTTVSAGQVLDFSPALLALSSPNPKTDVDLSGLVIDSVNKAAISGATIDVTGAATAQATTDSTGKFTLAGLAAGQTTVTVSAPGFQTSALSLLTSAGSTIDLGVIQLEQTVLPSTSRVTGTIVDLDTGLPINGATVLLEGTGVTATSDVNGRYTIDGIGSLEFSLLASASGYLSAFQSVGMTQFGVTSIDFSLRQSSVNGMSIDGLWTNQLAYDAYKTVNITSVIRNGGSAAGTVKILLEVLDGANRHVRSLYVEQGGTIKAPVESYNILPGATLDIASNWFVGNIPPGAYKIGLKVYDHYTNALLSERSSLVTIQPTQVIEQADLKATPRFANMGATEQLILNLDIINKSNIDNNLTVSYELLAPGGGVIVSGEKSFVITPDNVSATIALANTPITFAESGNYQATFSVVSGTIPLQQNNTVISVAPSIRVEASQGISPAQVVPDGDKRIRINIQLKGVEAQ